MLEMDFPEACIKYDVNSVNGSTVGLSLTSLPHNPALTSLLAHYTETERSQHILHSDPRIFGQSYVANTSSVAGKDVFLGEKPDNSVPEFFQGLALFREEGAPTSLSSRDMQDVLQSSELVEFDRYSNLEPKKKARKRQILLGRLQREALVSKQHRYIRERRDWKVLTKGKVREPCATDSNDPLQIIPERARLAEKMSSYSPLSSEESKEAMQDLHALLKQDFGVFYRPGEAPVKGACPFCHGSLEM